MTRGKLQEARWKYKERIGSGTFTEFFCTILANYSMHDLNKITVQAIQELEEGKGLKAKSTSKLFQDLKVS